jgi:integrase
MQEKSKAKQPTWQKVPGHPGIFKKRNRYYATWRHRGKLRAKSFRTLTEAARFKAATRAGATQPTSRQPFQSFAPRWIETYGGRTATGISEATRTSYADALTRYAIPFFGTTKLEDIDPPLIKEFIRHLAQMGLAPSTISRHLAPVRALLADAYEDGLIRHNPTVRVVVPNQGRRKQKRRLTADETKALLREIPSEFADLTYLLAATGLRIGEALAACWGDVGRDTEGRPVLSIPQAKTESGLRLVSLSPETAQRLVRRRTDARYATDSDPIFPNGRGREIDQHNFRQRIFRPAASRAGVPWATPYALRHGLATLMADLGFTPAQIAAQLGHADGGVLALKTYIHVDRVEQADFIDEVFGDGLATG